MPEPTTYEIVLRGRPSRRLLHPFLDDFTITTSTSTSPGITPGPRPAGEGDVVSVTRLVGEVGDPAHLHGIVKHLTSVNLQIISIGPATACDLDAINAESDPTR